MDKGNTIHPHLWRDIKIVINSLYLYKIIIILFWDKHKLVTFSFLLLKLMNDTWCVCSKGTNHYLLFILKRVNCSNFRILYHRRRKLYWSVKIKVYFDQMNHESVKCFTNLGHLNLLHELGFLSTLKVCFFLPDLLRVLDPPNWCTDDPMVWWLLLNGMECADDKAGNDWADAIVLCSTPEI